MTSAERFIIEWNTGSGWQSDENHRFTAMMMALKCASDRRECEKDGKWPMRMKHRQPNGTETILDIA